MKVKNMTSDKGRAIPNQFIVETEKGTYFQSYDSVIVRKPKGNPCFPTNNPDMKIELDESTWDYSRTTSKYRNQFLGEDTKTTKAKIKSGEYILVNLN